MKNMDFIIKHLWCIALIPWLVTLIFAYFGCSQIYRSMQVKTFEPVPAHIENFQKDHRMGDRRREKIYTYDLFWTYNGQEYTKHVYHSSERPNPELTQIYVNANNTDVAVHNSLYYFVSAIKTFLFGLMALVLGFVFFKKCYPIGKNIQRREREQ